MEIVAVHADIQAAMRNRMLPDDAEYLGQTLRQINAAALHPDQHHLVAVAIALGDFVGDAGQRALQGRGCEDDGPFSHKHVSGENTWQVSRWESGQEGG